MKIRSWLDNDGAGFVYAKSGGEKGCHFDYEFVLNYGGDSVQFFEYAFENKKGAEMDKEQVKQKKLFLQKLKTIRGAVESLIQEVEK